MSRRSTKGKALKRGERKKKKNRRNFSFFRFVTKKFTIWKDRSTIRGTTGKDNWFPNVLKCWLKKNSRVYVWYVNFIGIEFERLVPKSNWFRIRNPLKIRHWFVSFSFYQGCNLTYSKINAWKPAQIPNCPSNDTNGRLIEEKIKFHFSVKNKTNEKRKFFVSFFYQEISFVLGGFGSKYG